MKRPTILLALAATLLAQNRAGLVPPREIDRAARKVERAWTAWQETRLELRLLEKQSGDALSAIDRSSQLADQYVDAKAAYYGLVAAAFDQQARSLDREPLETPGKQRGAVEQHLRRLLDQEAAIRSGLAALENKPMDGRVALLREAYQAELQTVGKLGAEARRQIDALGEAGLTAEQWAKERQNAAAAFHQVAAALGQLRETAGLEGEDWAAYHDHLRELVRTFAGRKETLP